MAELGFGGPGWSNYDTSGSFDERVRRGMRRIDGLPIGSDIPSVTGVSREPNQTVGVSTEIARDLSPRAGSDALAVGSVLLGGTLQNPNSGTGNVHS